jgi:magnesium-transporting ATPase (P-type)
METTAGETGLTQSEAQRRLAQYGYNELPEAKRNPLLVVVGW